MRKASLAVTMTAGDSNSGDYGPGEQLLAGDLTITINRVRGAGVTMSTSAGQDIALGVDESDDLLDASDAVIGSITCTGIVEEE